MLDSRPALKALARAATVRSLLRLVDRALYIGSENRRFFEAHGMAPERLFATPYSVDTEFFRAEAARLRSRRAQLKRSFGLDPAVPAVLFSGKLIEKKDPGAAVRALATVRRHHPFALLIAGDGPLRGALESEIERASLRGVVKLAGFLNQSQMPRAYAAADLLVLPSLHHETWGLVVNEAMNFGLPLVVSDRVGSAADLVEPGRNGFIVPAGRPEALAAAIGELAGRDRRRAFGQRSLELIRGWGIVQTADGIEAALHASLRPAAA